MIPNFDDIYEKLKDNNEATPPSRKEIITIIKDIQSTLFPNYFESSASSLDFNAIYKKIA